MPVFRASPSSKKTGLIPIYTSDLLQCFLPKGSSSLQPCSPLVRRLARGVSDGQTPWLVGALTSRRAICLECVTRINAVPKPSSVSKLLSFASDDSYLEMCCRRARRCCRKVEREGGRRMVCCIERACRLRLCETI